MKPAAQAACIFIALCVLSGAAVAFVIGSLIARVVGVLP